MFRGRKHILFALGAIALILSAGAALAEEQRPFFVDVIKYGWHSGTHYGSYIDSEGQFRVGTHSGLHEAYYVVSVPVTREEFKTIQEAERQQAVCARSLVLQKIVPPLENQPRVPLTILKGGLDALRVPPLGTQPQVPLRVLDRAPLGPVAPPLENMPRVPLRSLGVTPAGK